jgi:hypothetical protein
VLTAQLEERVEKSIQSFLQGNIPAIKMVSFFFKYFFFRLEYMFKRIPQNKANTLREVIKNQVFEVIVPNAVQTIVSTNSITDLTIKEGLDKKIPIIIIDTIRTVSDIVLVKTTMLQSFMNGKIKIKKSSDIFKWLAPISSIQNTKMIQDIRKEDLALVESLLQELGY